MRLLTLAPCLIVATLPPARLSAAQATPPATRAAQPAESQHRILLACLSAYSHRTRADAQEKLLRMGEAVEPGLVHAAATAADPDARQRARTVLDEIRTQRRLREL